MKIRLKALAYQTRKGDTFDAHSLIDVPTDEGVELISAGIGDLYEHSTTPLETAVAKHSAEVRAEEPPVAPVEIAEGETEKEADAGKRTRGRKRKSG